MSTIPEQIRYAIIAAVFHDTVERTSARLCQQHPHLADAIRLYTVIALQVHKAVRV